MKTDNINTQVETSNEFEKDGPGIYRRWMSELDLASRYFEDYEKLCDKLENKYRNESKKILTGKTSAGDAKFSVLWSNSQTLLPAYYARTPVTQVERRFKDKDSVARLSSEALERAIEYQMEEYDFDDSALSTVLDLILHARGVGRVRFEADIAQKPGEETEEPYERVAEARVWCEHVNRADFRHNPARKWSEVRWVAFRSCMTRQQLRERFGARGAQCEVTAATDDMKDKSGAVKPEYEMFKQADVWEVWDKDTRRVYWISEGYKGGPLDAKDDLYGLKTFFPVPRPLFGTLTNSTLIPVPDYVEYQDQAAQLDELTVRIMLLTKALRISGVYDASQPELANVVSSTRENRLIPANNWAMLAQRGGLKGSVDFFPLKEVVDTLTALYEARDRVLQEIYEITGISDIIRGNSDPKETATAQQIKGQFGTLRISARQREVQRYFRDLLALKGELIAEKFTPELLRIASGFDYMTEVVQPGPPVPGPDGQPMPEPPEMRQMRVDQMWAQCVQLLKDEPSRNYRIDIETDSTIAVNDQMEQEQFSQYMQALNFQVQAVMTAAQGAPPLVPALGEIMMMGLRKFKAGRAAESLLETALEQIEEQVKNPPPPPPDPKMAEVQQKGEIEKEKLNLEAQKMQGEHQLNIEKFKLEWEKMQAEIQLQNQKLEAERAKTQMELEKLQATLAMEAEKVRIDQELRSREMSDRTNIETIKALKESGTHELGKDGKMKKKPKVRSRVRKVIASDGTPEWVKEDEEIPEEPVENG